MALFGGIGGALVGGATVRLVLDKTNFEAGLAEAKGQTEAASTTMGKFGGIAKQAFLVGGVASAAFAVAAVKAFNDTEEANLSLQNTLKNNKALGDVSTQSWQDQSHALQELTGITDEQTKSLYSLLGTFKLTGSEAQALTPLILALSQKFGIDLTAAGKAVGKALQGSTGSLQRYGIFINKAADGSVSFSSVLDALQGKVGGFSKSIAGTLPVRLAVLRANFQDLLASVGEKLVPVLTQAVDVLVKLGPVLGAIAPHVLELLAAFLAFKAVSFLPTLLLSIGVAAEALGLQSVATGALDAAAGLEAMGAAVVVAGLIAVVAEVGLLKDILSPTGGLQVDVANSTAALEEMGSTLTNTVVVGTQKLTKSLSLAVPILGNVFDATKNVAAATTSAGGAASNAADQTKIWAAAQRDAAQAARDLVLAEESLAGGLVGVEAAGLKVRQGQATLTQLQAAGKQGTAEYSAAVRDQQDNVLALAGAVNQYQAENAKSPATTAAAIQALEALGTKFGLTKGQIDAMAGAGTNAISVIDGIQNKLNGLQDKTVNITVHTTYINTGSAPHGGIQ